MKTLKIAAWNIYFSWNLVKRSKSSGKLYFPGGTQGNRREAVQTIIGEIDADVLGILECMSKKSLDYWIENEDALGHYTAYVKGGADKYNVGLLYNSDRVSIKTIKLNAAPWKARIGSDKSLRKYKFARDPLIVLVTDESSGTQFVLAVVHTKSKRVGPEYTGKAAYYKAIENRRRIVAEGLRLRELLFAYGKKKGAPYDQFLIMGDINDGPDLDEYESRIARSGVEAFIGSVLDPDRILLSFNDLSNGVGEATTPFGGGVQLDHMLYTQNMRPHSKGKPNVRDGAGRVRSDLVDIEHDGKSRDSDHAPVELVLTT